MVAFHAPRGEKTLKRPTSAIQGGSLDVPKAQLQHQISHAVSIDRDLPCNPWPGSPQGSSSIQSPPRRPHEHYESPIDRRSVLPSVYNVESAPKYGDMPTISSPRFLPNPRTLPSLQNPQMDLNCWKKSPKSSHRPPKAAAAKWENASPTLWTTCKATSS